MQPMRKPSWASLHKYKPLVAAVAPLNRAVAAENNAFAPTVESLEDGNGMDCRRTTGSASRRPRLRATVGNRLDKTPDRAAARSRHATPQAPPRCAARTARGRNVAGMRAD